MSARVGGQVAVEHLIGLLAEHTVADGNIHVASRLGLGGEGEEVEHLAGAGTVEVNAGGVHFVHRQVKAGGGGQLLEADILGVEGAGVVVGGLVGVVGIAIEGAVIGCGVAGDQNIFIIEGNAAVRAVVGAEHAGARDGDAVDGNVVAVVHLLVGGVDAHVPAGGKYSLVSAAGGIAGPVVGDGCAADVGVDARLGAENGHVLCNGDLLGVCTGGQQYRAACGDGLKSLGKLGKAGGADADGIGGVAYFDVGGAAGCACERGGSHYGVVGQSSRADGQRHGEQGTQHRNC